MIALVKGGGDETQTLEGSPASPGVPSLTPGAARAPLAPADRLGRFVVERKLGEGGAGVVYEAYDELLERKVALKVLRASGDPEWSRRLLREARSAASLPHPNVVAVYDVGTTDQGLYIAMELVDGIDARAWRARAPRTARQILAVYLEAGRGLAAAHRAGLVHRDVKPDNILVGEDRARVADFGLARPPGNEVAPADVNDGGGFVTRTGTILGTPRYMAPEQRRGVTDARSDQYSFCVALWEALTGDVPAAAGPAPDLPRFIRRALLRGLRPAPAERWPDMEALLRALGRDPARTWRRIALGVTAAGAVAALALALVMRRPGPSCDGGEARHRAVWNDARRASLRAVFAASGRGHAAATFAKIEAALDRHARDWMAARIDACEDTLVRGEQSPQLLDLRMGCLDRRLTDVDSVLQAVQTGGGDTIDLALDAVRSATRDLCADAASAQPSLPLPADPRLRAQIDVLTLQLSLARGLFDTGRHLDALARLQAIGGAARATGYPPLGASLLRLLGEALSKAGRTEESEATWREAIRVAATARDDELVAQSWLGLLWELGERQHRHGDALALVTAAEGAIARAGDPPLLAGQLALTLGVIRSRMGDLDEAVVLLRKSLALSERSGSPSKLSTSLMTLGIILTKTGAYAEAQALLERGLALDRERYGDDHPRTAPAYMNLGNLFLRLGRWDDALAMHEKALAIFRATYGPRHGKVADGLVNLALACSAAGDVERAERFFREALPLFEGLGDGKRTSQIHMELGQLALRRDRDQEALAECRASRLILEEAALSDSTLWWAMRCQSKAARRLGRHDEAVEAGERAVAVAEGFKEQPAKLARVRFVLAQALWDSKKDRRRALALAEAALPLVAEGERAEVASELERWKRR